MMRTMLKSKIFYATVKELKLFYRGSVTVDEDIMKAADLLEKEKVEVLNLNNGARFETYVIKGEKNSGMVCLNGPAARLAHENDKIIILSYGLYDKDELKDLKTHYVELDDGNKIKDTFIR